jgi:hypothetical protein
LQQLKISSRDGFNDHLMTFVTPRQLRPTTSLRAIKVLIVFLLVCQGAACFMGSAVSLAGRVDLRAFYGAGQIVRTGYASQLYDYTYQDKVQNEVVSPRVGALPFLYPPFAAVLFVPLSLLTYHQAFGILLVANIGLLIIAAMLLAPWLPGLCNRSWPLLASMFGCLFAVSVALMQGQISFILLVVYCGTYVLLRQERGALAGLVCSLALIKFQLALPVLLLFILWRQWSFVRGFLVGAACLGGISIAIVGSTGLASYWRSLFTIASTTSHNALAAKARYGMFPAEMPNLHGFMFAISHGAPWGVVLTITLSALVLGWSARRSPSLLVALPAAMLISYHMQPHDLILILVPLSFATNELVCACPAFSQRGELTERRMAIALIGVGVMLSLPVAAVAMITNHGYVMAVPVIAIWGISCFMHSCKRNGQPRYRAVFVS